MTLRRLGGALGLAAGASWIATAVLGKGSDLWTTLGGAALVLVLVAFACWGAALVKGQARWLAVVVALAFPLLAWTMHQVVVDVAGDTTLVRGALGAVFVVLGAAFVLRGSSPRGPGASGASTKAPSHRA